VEKPLVSSINDTKSSDTQPKRFRRGGNNPTGLNRFLNVVNPLKTAEKKKYRLLKGAEIGDLAMVKGALNDGADVNTRNDSGRTVLIIASIKGHLEIVRELLSGEGHQGAAVDAADSRGMTPLCAASSKGHLEVVRELLSGQGHPSALIDAATTDGATPLILACWAGHIEVVKELLFGEGHPGAAVDASTNNGMTPLKVAATPEIKELLKQAMSKTATGGRRRHYTYAKHQRRTKRKSSTRRKV
jgi:ankyrin repeat protein